MRQGSTGSTILVVCLVNLSTAWVAHACTEALENAYWRFEEGVAGTIVPAGEQTILDSLNPDSGNTLMRWTNPDPEADPDATAPLYTTNVPTAVVPRTGHANTLALQFARIPDGTGGQDIYGGNCANKAKFQAFTLEASFNVTFAGGGAEFFQGIVCKEGAVSDGLPRLALKVRGDDGRLHIEMFDGSGTARGVRSIDPIVPNQWYHAAVVNDGSDLALYLKAGGGDYHLQGMDVIQVGPDGEVLHFADSSWVIGRAQYYDHPADWTDGIIDEVRLSTRALDESEFLYADPPKRGDFNGDDLVDSEDMLLLINCATGPEVPYDPANPPAGCSLTAIGGLLPPDLDEDGDIDSTDFAIFQPLLGS